MTEKVVAAVQTGIETTELREFNMPDIPPDAGLLKIEASGVCGSDWPKYKKFGEPRILGHEIIGRIAKLGKIAASRWGVKEGDRVALEEYLPCGHCKLCRTGEFRSCASTDTWVSSNSIRYGSTSISVEPSLWGGYSEYMFLHPNSMLHKLPEHISATEATMALPIGNGIQWTIVEGGMKFGDTVVIQGPGQQGLACILAAKAGGAGRIIVSGLSGDNKRFEMARKFGADFVVNVEHENLYDRVKEITGGDMADLTIDTSSGGTATVTLAIEIARKRGTVVLASAKQKAIQEFYCDNLITKGLSLKGVRGHSFSSVEDAIEIIGTGKYPLHEMATHQYSLSEVDQALKTVGGKGDQNAVHVTVLPLLENISAEFAANKMASTLTNN